MDLMPSTTLQTQIMRVWQFSYGFSRLSFKFLKNSVEYIYKYEYFNFWNCHFVSSIDYNI